MEDFVDMIPKFDWLQNFSANLHTIFEEKTLMEISAKTGIGYRTLENFYNGWRSPRSYYLNLIDRAYPELNINWNDVFLLPNNEFMNKWYGWCTHD